MWENERKVALLRNIVIFLLLVLMTAGLFYGVKTTKKRIAEEDALLEQERANQLQNINDTREENLKALQLAYEKDLETIEQYVPGIVCWGDSLTAGSSGNVSYPRTLQKCIDTYLCEIYDLRYSVEDTEGISRVDWEQFKISIPVVNMGAGQEDAETVLGRAGVMPYVVGSAFTIPSGTEPVDIEILSESGEIVTPLTAGSVGINPVTINGIQGELTLASYDHIKNRYYYQFARLEEGEEMEIAEGEKIFTACANQYQNYIHIVWVGTYGDFTTPDKLVKDVKTLLQRQNVNTDRYLVIGPCTIKGVWGTNTSYTMNAIDSAMLQAFGDRYINLRKYLIEDGLRDAGLTTPTYMERGVVPTAFRSTAGGADMNGVAYKLTGKLVYERMNMLGFFDEIREELNLDIITQNILKSDSKYFERRMEMDD